MKDFIHSVRIVQGKSQWRIYHIVGCSLGRQIVRGGKFWCILGNLVEKPKLTENGNVS